MFIWEDEPKDKKSMQVIAGPKGNKVRFRKYANKIFVNVLEFIEPFSNEDKAKMLEDIRYCLPKEWKTDLSKLWADIEVFEKGQKNLTKNYKKEVNKKGWLEWLQHKTMTK